MDAALHYADVFGTPSVENLQPLDIGLDESELKNLAHTLQVLHQFTATFNDQRAVCQAQVKQLIEECDVALDKRYPLQSFTQAPSQTNLAVVTESVLARVGSAFSEYLKRFLDFVKKVFGWIIEAAKRLFKRNRQTMHQVVVIHAIREATREVQHVAPAKDQDESKHGSLIQAFYDAVDQYDGQMTEMGMQMLQQGPYVAAVKSLAHAVLSVNSMLDKKLQEIERRLNTHVTNSSGEATYEDFNGLTESLPTPHALLRALKAWLRYDNDIEAWADVINVFRDSADHLAQEKPHTVIEWNIAAGVIVSPHSGMAEPMVPVADAVIDYVKDMEKLIDDCRKHAVTRSVQPPHAQKAEQALHSYLEDVRSMLKYMEITNLTLDTQYHLTDAVARCVKADFDLQCASRAIDDTTRERIRAIRENLQAKIVDR